MAVIRAYLGNSCLENKICKGVRWLIGKRSLDSCCLRVSRWLWEVEQYLQGAAFECNYGWINRTIGIWSLRKKGLKTIINTNYTKLVGNADYVWVTFIPEVAGLGAKPSNKSIIGEPPAAEEICAEGVDGEDNLCKLPLEVVLSWLVDKMSDENKLLWAGGVPIDKRSNRTSVPLFWAWLVPRIPGRMDLRCHDENHIIQNEKGKRSQIETKMKQASARST